MTLRRSALLALLFLVAACSGGGGGTEPTTTTAAGGETTTSIGSESSTTTVAPQPGHPGPGFHHAAGVPADFDGYEGDFGWNVAMATTAAGDPVIVYEVHDGNHDGIELDDSSLFAVTWDAATGAFRPPVEVGDTVTNGSDGQVAMGTDRATGTIALAYPAADGALVFTTSTDDGATWAQPVELQTADASPRLPSVASAGGRAVVAFLDDVNVVSVATVGEDVSVLAPPTTGAPLADVGPSVAASAGGTLGVAYVEGGEADLAVDYWQVDSAAPARALESGGVPNAAPSLGLGFVGDDPFVGVTMSLAGDEAGTGAYVVSSTNGGQSFSEPAPVPPDHEGGETIITRVAASDAGEAAFAYEPAGGSGEECGRPKLSRSVDLKAWTTCSPDDDDSRGVVSGVPYLATGAAGALFLTFTNFATQDSTLAPGVWLWVG